MASEVELDRALASISATLNDQELGSYDVDRVQAIVNSSLGGKSLLRVDDAGGLHEVDGPRVGAIRRTSSGEWIVERQDETAARSETAIPAPPEKRFLRKVLSRLQSWR